MLYKMEYYLDKLDEFPTLPTIYSSLMAVLSNPNTTIQDVADIISRDQSSTMKILGAANSSVYSLQNHVTNLNQAIFYIGFKEVRNLLLSISVIDMFSNIRSFSSINIIDFWKHSIAVGVISRHLAKLCNVKDMDNFFLAGIIHDIGKLFFMEFFKEEYNLVLKSVYRGNNILIREAESKVFGIDHCQAGEMISNKWNLPPFLKNVIKYHETAFPEGRFDMLCTCVHLANIIARIMELGNPGDNMIPEPNFEIWEYLNISNSSFTDLHDEILADYKQSADILLLHDDF